MRLSDADAEIKKIEEEIKRSYKAIDRWRSGGMPGSSLYDIDEKVRRIKKKHRRLQNRNQNAEKLHYSIQSGSNCKETGRQDRICRKINGRKTGG